MLHASWNDRKWIMFSAIGLNLAVTLLFNILTARAAGPMTFHITRTDDGPQNLACYASGTNCTIRNAILSANANPGSTIKLALSKTYVLTDTTQGALAITSDMTITTETLCTGTPCPVTIQGMTGWNKRIMSVALGAHAYLENLTLRNGASGSFYGGALINNGITTMSLCNLTSNSSTDRGGSLYNAGSLTMNDCSISHNSSMDGGGIYNASTGAMTLDNVDVFTNTVVHAGGGIFNAGQLTISDSNVYMNTATGNSSSMSFGGGFYNDAGGHLQIRNAYISGNHALNGESGGIYIANGTVSISASYVDGNFSWYNAGVYNAGTLHVLNNTSISFNHASAGAGGLANSNTLTMDNARVAYNTTDTSGGGGMQNGGDAQLSNTWVAYNSAVTGGGIQNDYALQLNGNMDIVSNTATLRGGGLYNAGGGLVTADGVNFGYNQAPLGAGVYQTSTMTMTLTHANFIGNIASTNGGGLYSNAQSGPILIDYSRFESNKATNGSGGGLYQAYTSGDVTINHTTLVSNTAPITTGYNGGGALYTNAILNLSNSTLNGNSTGRDGGAIKNNNGFISLVNMTLSGNSAGRNGGGLEGGGGSINFYNTTLANNLAVSQGGGIFTADMVSPAKFRNTLVGGNLAPTGPDCSGTYNSQGYNLIQSLAGCNITGGSGDWFNVSPVLDILKNNGGPTWTHAVLTGSPAINGGDPAGCVDGNLAPLKTDQRGNPRPIGSRCDIGAFEAGSAFYLPLLLR